MSDRLGWNNGGQIGSAVAIGATLTGSGGVAVGRHLLGSPYGGEGYVYIYNNARSNFGTSVDDTRLQNPQASRRGAEGFGMFGNRLYARADLLNGDGRVDLVVAAPRHSDTQQSGGIGYTGRVLVYPGTTGTTMSTTPGWAVTGPSFNSGFGRGLAAADVNGDGFMDLLVGAPFRQVNAGNDGAVYVYAGSASGLSSTTAAQMVAGPAIYGQFGEAIAPAGDLNRDGCPDVVIGAPNTGDNVEGAVYVFRGCDSVTGFLGATPAHA